MAVFMIATIMKDKDITGMRLLDCSTRTVRDLEYAKIYTAIEKGQLRVDNLKLDKGKIMGYNGAIDRYTKIVNNRVDGKTPAVVIAANAGKFVCANYKGNMGIMTEEQLVGYAQHHGIANGKVVDGQVRAIDGTYKTDYDSSNIKAPQEQVDMGRTAILERCYKDGEWILSEELVNCIYTEESEQFLGEYLEKIGCEPCLLMAINEIENKIHIVLETERGYDMHNVSVITPSGEQYNAKTNRIAELSAKFSDSLDYVYTDQQRFNKAVEIARIAIKSWCMVVRCCMEVEVPIELEVSKLGNNVTIGKFDREQVLHSIKAKLGNAWILFWRLYTINYLTDGKEIELYSDGAIDNAESIDALLTYVYLYTVENVMVNTVSKIS